MKIKVFSSISESNLEKKVNKFLENNNINIIEMQFVGGFGFIAIMIRFEDMKS